MTRQSLLCFAIRRNTVLPSVVVVLLKSQIRLRYLSETFTPLDATWEQALTGKLRNLMLGLNYRYGQGYLFPGPMPPQSLTALLEKGACLSPQGQTHVSALVRILNLRF